LSSLSKVIQRTGVFANSRRTSRTQPPQLRFSRPGTQLSPDTLLVAAPLKNLDRSEGQFRYGPDSPDATLLDGDLHDRTTGEALDLAFVIVIGPGEIHFEATAKTVDFHFTLLVSLTNSTAPKR
jgi:hypothetical protein